MGGGHPRDGWRERWPLAAAGLLAVVALVWVGWEVSGRTASCSVKGFAVVAPIEEDPDVLVAEYVPAGDGPASVTIDGSTRRYRWERGDDWSEMSFSPSADGTSWEGGGTAICTEVTNGRRSWP